jgi:hypothetical protein
LDFQEILHLIQVEGMKYLFSFFRFPVKHALGNYVMPIEFIYIIEEKPARSAFSESSVED